MPTVLSPERKKNAQHEMVNGPRLESVGCAGKGDTLRSNEGDTESTKSAKKKKQNKKKAAKAADVELHPCVVRTKMRMFGGDELTVENSNCSSKSRHTK